MPQPISTTVWTTIVTGGPRVASNRSPTGGPRDTLSKESNKDNLNHQKKNYHVKDTLRKKEISYSSV